jgi:hypothetical protein
MAAVLAELLEVFERAEARSSFRVSLGLFLGSQFSRRARGLGILGSLACFYFGALWLCELAVCGLR